MYIGVHLAQLGRLADPAAVRASARAAEALGYRSVWVLDRLLASPAADPARLDGDGGRSLPDHSAQILDPLGVLTYVAASTERVRLGTSILVAPWYPQGLLARALTTLDVLSAGRLTVGLGTGSSTDDDRAAGVGGSAATNLEATVDALQSVWGDAPLTLDGGAVQLDTARVALKPVQRPQPPILLGGHAPATLHLIARRANGWNPVNLPTDRLARLWTGLRDEAAAHGRDPDVLQLVVRATLRIEPTALPAGRRVYEGSLEQVVDDLEATRRAGADEVILGLAGEHNLDIMLDAYATLAEALEMQSAGHGRSPIEN